MLVSNNGSMLALNIGAKMVEDRCNMNRIYGLIMLKE